MKSTLYVTDLDGTLLTPEESLSPGSRKNEKTGGNDHENICDSKP